MRFDNSLPCDIPQMDLLSVPNTQSVVESGSWFLIPAEADFQDLLFLKFKEMIVIYELIII